MGKDKKGRKYVVQMAQNHNLSIRMGDWKYITPCEGPAMIPWGAEIETGYSKEPQLYHLSSPYENENLSEKYPKKVKKMQSQNYEL